ncbi:MAG: DNA-directed RNA polymerase subunit D [Candidatus Geothermarchaeota archaeon]
MSGVKDKKVEEIQIEIIEHSENKISMLLKNIPVIVANSIRRAIMSYVPTLAIDKVYIFKNSSLMNDNMLAHRLGLIPLKMPLNEMPALPIDKDIDEDFHVTLTLRVEAREKPITVLSSHLKSTSPFVKIPIGDIEIVKLMPGQEIEAEMWAYVGRGRLHAKWSPVSIAVVRGLPIVNLPSSHCNQGCEKCIEACPKGLLYRDRNIIKIKDIYSCTVCKLCEDNCPGGYIKVNIDESSSLLYFESIGQLEPSEIIESAFNELLKEIDAFYDSFSKVEFDGNQLKK